MRAKWAWVAVGLCASAACASDSDSHRALPATSHESNPAPSMAPADAHDVVPALLNRAAAAASEASSAAPPMAAAPAASAGADSKPPEPSPSEVQFGPAAPPRVDDMPLIRKIPTDKRAVKTADALAPISGGTLALTADDHYAVASDPDRDRVSVVDLSTGTLAWTVALHSGDEPGRVVIDESSHAHVALRRGGAVVTIDITTGKLLERRDVCAAPRGIAYDATDQRLFVACRSGELVALPLTGTAGIARHVIAVDLRDVIAQDGHVFVSRFKTSELLVVDANGTLASTARPDPIPALIVEADGAQRVDALDPLAARRTVAQYGTMMMLHQTARASEITIHPNGAMLDAVQAGGGSPYGSGGCSAVAGTAVTTFDSNGKFVDTVQLGMATVAVDIARWPRYGTIAVAVAGANDPFQPQSFNVSADSAAASLPAPDTGTSPTDDPAFGPHPPIPGVLVYTGREGGVGDLTSSRTTPKPGKCLAPNGFIDTHGPATAVAYTSDGRLIVQVREPATILIGEAVDGTGRAEVALGGASVLDTGHEIFHRDAAAGIACATCHLEGEEDGHTWRFEGQGPRRTQSLSVGLEGTAPFHWVGDMTDLGALIEDVFVGRMGGVHESQPRLDALQRYLFALHPPAPLRAADDPAAVRGHELFVGGAECSTCHDGPKLTNNQTVDVGTDLALQVPSLIGVGVRGPWLHDGCAKTLQQRFDPRCGGDAHGKTAQLTAAQVDDLVAYLETL